MNDFLRALRPSATGRSRLGVAVTRGLLLDLLATGDRDGVEAAMEHFITIYQTATEHKAARPDPASRTADAELANYHYTHRDNPLGDDADLEEIEVEIAHPLSASITKSTSRRSGTSRSEE